jgi:hypothetical protein
MEGWMDGGMDGWRDGWLAGWMDGGMEGWRDGWMEGWMDGWWEGISDVRMDEWQSESVQKGMMATIMLLSLRFHLASTLRCLTLRRASNRKTDGSTGRECIVVALIPFLQATSIMSGDGWTRQEGIASYKTV